jgi:hypothetical protein
MSVCSCKKSRVSFLNLSLSLKNISLPPSSLRPGVARCEGAVQVRCVDVFQGLGLIKPDLHK